MKSQLTKWLNTTSLKKNSGHYAPPKTSPFWRTRLLQLAETLKTEADIPWSSIGISGSIMAGLTTEKSDIDPLVYGAENCRKAYAALKAPEDEHSGFKPYTESELQELFDFRSKDTQMSFEDFVLVESRKAFQGKFMGTDYFIRFVKDWREINEQYGDVCFKNSGYAKITAKIADSAQTRFSRPAPTSCKTPKLLKDPTCRQ